MRQLLYAMRFAGHATQIGEVGGILRAATASPGSILTTTIGPDGIDGVIVALPGGEASFESEVTFTSETSFLESGAIHFGNGHWLCFTTAGSSYLAPGADPARRHGAVTLRIAGGEGQFAGASGLITSNFFVGDDLALTDHHFGVFFIPESDARERTTP